VLPFTMPLVITICAALRAWLTTLLKVAAE